MFRLGNLKIKMRSVDTETLCRKYVEEYLEEFDATFEGSKDRNASVTKCNLMLGKRCCEETNSKFPYDARNASCDMCCWWET